MNTYNSDLSFDRIVQDLSSKYARLELQEEDIKFYKQCCLTNFLHELHASTLPEFPFPAKFFSELFHGNEDSIDTVMSIIRSTLCKDAVYLDTIAHGYMLTAVEVHFDVGGLEYYLSVPVLEHISEIDLKNEYGINWNVASYHISQLTGSHVWKQVWSGYRLSDCKLFSESDPKEVPFE